VTEGLSRLRPRHPFVWQSRLPRSKSWCNRALVLRSWAEAKGLRLLDGTKELQLLELGDDVAKLALAFDTPIGQAVDLWASGTGFRFYLARRSRDAGVHVVCGSQRLLARPHADLLRALEQLGVRVERGGEDGGRDGEPERDAWRIHSSGWREPAGGWLEISAATSSQFASALLLSALKLDFDFRMRVVGEVVSEGYLALTVQLLRQAGVDVQTPSSGEYVIPRGQVLQAQSLSAEPDLSTAATLAALGLADPNSRVRFELDDEAAARDSLQPDREFWRIAHNLREPLRQGEQRLRAISANLRGCPDLFPVLAALGALAEGTSTLQGAEHLRAKESDRIAGMVELLRGLGLDVVEFPDGLAITGCGDWAKAREHFAKRPVLRFNPREDHRLAFAAGLLALAGARIELTDRTVVKKSFPQFWNVLEGHAPRICVAGHRGVGKSTALIRWRRWCDEVGVRAEFVDLDAEIAARCGRSVARIFAEDGEDEFRRLESQTFCAWARERKSVPLIVFVGGGFDVSQVDASWTRVWLRRVTDRDDRLFTDDRPSLGEGDERLVWRSRRDAREARFRVWADRALELQEAAEWHEDVGERAWVLDLLGVASFPQVGGVVTLAKSQHPDFWRQAARWGASLELRDDLLGDFSSAEFQALRDELPLGARCIFSRRRGSQLPLIHGADYDWPLEDLQQFPEAAAALSCLDGTRLVLSDHSSTSPDEVDARVAEALQHWTGDESRVWVKWAVATRSFRELQERDQWRRAGPRRIFLPMSEDGRWKWYRLQFAPAEFQFWREAEGSAADQPTATECLWRQELKSEFFAAVVGAPIAHSRTPLEQREFFARYSWPVYAIRVEREEWAEAWPVLRDLGLRAAAVTSPLKEVVACAVDASGVGSGDLAGVSGVSSVGFLGAVNSVVWNARGDWLAATSTDAAWSPPTHGAWERGGLAEWERLRPAVLWGGSGMIGAVKQMFPGVVAYSASRGFPREDVVGNTGVSLGGVESHAPELLIWGAGSSELKSWPWGEHRPKVVFDLSYQENSEARLVAKRFGASYVSGLELFQRQASAQRDFFRAHLASVEAGFAPPRE
jgi:3-phosphoshikimate 1-carboxyvinyltransferase